jgi:methylmalonyl-CoA/ethylmalonyl-CoA epimerase
MEKISYIEHIGIAVRNLENAISFYEKVLGLKCYKIENIPDQKVRTAFLRVGETKLELLESTDSEGPIGKFIEKKGEGLHHIAFAVEGIEEQLAHATKMGIQLIDNEPRKGADNLEIAFLHPRTTAGVLIELCEDKHI